MAAENEPLEILLHLPLLAEDKIIDSDDVLGYTDCNETDLISLYGQYIPLGNAHCQSRPGKAQLIPGGPNCSSLKGRRSGLHRWLMQKKKREIEFVKAPSDSCQNAHSLRVKSHSPSVLSQFTKKKQQTFSLSANKSLSHSHTLSAFLSLITPLSPQRFPHCSATHCTILLFSLTKYHSSTRYISLYITPNAPTMPSRMCIYISSPFSEIFVYSLFYDPVLP
ncbi:Uncharacterized protein Fot_36786 [Forsythia ovata]|uniref:Uncharacterized protein n=1 Tax=Forsythia ovata TaxID=205694 RepID=A0ABD1SQF5_9LAMI